MDEIKNDYIEKALSELIPKMGVKEFVDHKKLIRLIESKKVKECIKEIALYLGLPIEVNFSYIPKGYHPGANNGFQSTHLVKTDEHNRGTDGIAAQVFFLDLPLYGTSRMINFPVNVWLREDLVENPATLIAVMAHELSHIVLHSMRHKEKSNEYYTDLTAMLLGFALITRIGRKVVKSKTDHRFLTTVTTTSTARYGYLSDKNFYFAFNRIEREVIANRKAKNDFLQTIGRSEKRIGRAKKHLFRFGEYLAYVDKNLNQKISREDGQKIGMFHMAGHTDGLLSAVRKNETDLKNFVTAVDDLHVYTEHNVKTVRQYETRLKASDIELGKEYASLKNDLIVLKKYVGLFYRLKLYFAKPLSGSNEGASAL